MNPTGHLPSTSKSPSKSPSTEPNKQKGPTPVRTQSSRPKSQSPLSQLHAGNIIKNKNGKSQVDEKIDLNVKRGPSEKSKPENRVTNQQVVNKQEKNVEPIKKNEMSIKPETNATNVKQDKKVQMNENRKTPPISSSRDVSTSPKLPGRRVFPDDEVRKTSQGTLKVDAPAVLRSRDPRVSHPKATVDAAIRVDMMSVLRNRKQPRLQSPPVVSHTSNIPKTSSISVSTDVSAKRKKKTSVESLETKSGDKSPPSPLPSDLSRSSSPARSSSRTSSVRSSPMRVHVTNSPTLPKILSPVKTEKSAKSNKLIKLVSPAKIIPPIDGTSPLRNKSPSDNKTPSRGTSPSFSSKTVSRGATASPSTNPPSRGATVSSSTNPPSRGDTPSSSTNPPSRGDTPSSSTNPLSRGDTPSSSTNPPSRGGTPSSSTNPPSKGGTPSSSTNPPSRGGTPSSDTNPPSRGGTPSSGTNPPSRGGTPSSSTNPPTESVSPTENTSKSASVASSGASSRIGSPLTKFISPSDIKTPQRVISPSKIGSTLKKFLSPSNIIKSPPKIISPVKLLQNWATSNSQTKHSTERESPTIMVSTAQSKSFDFPNIQSPVQNTSMSRRSLQYSSTSSSLPSSNQDFKLVSLIHKTKESTTSSMVSTSADESQEISSVRPSKFRNIKPVKLQTTLRRADRDGELHQPIPIRQINEKTLTYNSVQLLKHSESDRSYETQPETESAMQSTRFRTRPTVISKRASISVVQRVIPPLPSTPTETVTLTTSPPPEVKLISTTPPITSQAKSAVRSIAISTSSPQNTPDKLSKTVVSTNADGTNVGLPDFILSKKSESLFRFPQEHLIEQQQLQKQNDSQLQKQKDSQLQTQIDLNQQPEDVLKSKTKVIKRKYSGLNKKESNVLQTLRDILIWSPEENDESCNKVKNKTRNLSFINHESNEDKKQPSKVNEKQKSSSKILVPEVSTKFSFSAISPNISTNQDTIQVTSQSSSTEKKQQITIKTPETSQSSISPAMIEVLKEILMNKKILSEQNSNSTSREINIDQNSKGDTKNKRSSHTLRTRPSSPRNDNFRDNVTKNISTRQSQERMSKKEISVDNFDDLAFHCTSAEEIQLEEYQRKIRLLDERRTRSRSLSPVSCNSKGKQNLRKSSSYSKENSSKRLSDDNINGAIKKYYSTKSLEGDADDEDSVSRKSKSKLVQEMIDYEEERNPSGFFLENPTSFTTVGFNSPENILLDKIQYALNVGRKPSTFNNFQVSDLPSNVTDKIITNVTNSVTSNQFQHKTVPTKEESLTHIHFNEYKCDTISEEVKPEVKVVTFSNLPKTFTEKLIEVVSSLERSASKDETESEKETEKNGELINSMSKLKSNADTNFEYMELSNISDKSSLRKLKPKILGDVDFPQAIDRKTDYGVNKLEVHLEQGESSTNHVILDPEEFKDVTSSLQDKSDFASKQQNLKLLRIKKLEKETRTTRRLENNSSELSSESSEMSDSTSCRLKLIDEKRHFQRRATTSPEDNGRRGSRREIKSPEIYKNYFSNENCKPREENLEGQTSLKKFQRSTSTTKKSQSSFEVFTKQKDELRKKSNSPEINKNYYLDEYYKPREGYVEGELCQQKISKSTNTRSKNELSPDKLADTEGYFDEFPTYKPDGQSSLLGMPFPSAEKKFVQEVRPRRRSIERDPDGTGYFDDDSSSESDSYFKKIKHISKKSTSSSQNKLKRNLTTKQFVDSYYNLTDIESSSNEDFKKKIREQTSNTPDKGTQTKLKESASAKSPEFTPTNPQILEDPENESQSRAPRFAMAVLSSTLSAVQTELRPQCNVVKSLCNLSLSFKRFVSRKQTSNVETRFGSKKADDSADDQNFGVAIVSKNPFKLSATVVKSLDKISETIRQILGSKKLSEQNIIEPQPQSKESEDNVIFKIPSYLSEDECEDQIHKIEETNEQTEKKDPKSSISLIMEDPFPIPSCSEWFREEFNEDVHETQFGFRKSDLRAPVLRSVTLNERPPRKHVNEQPQVKYLEEDEEKEEEAEDVQLPKSHFAVAMVVDDKQNVTTTDTTSAVEKSLEQLSKLKLSVQQQPEQPVQKLPVQQQPAQPTQVLKNIPSSTRVKRLSINKQRESSSPNTTLTSRKSHVSTPLSVSESTTIKDKSKPRSPEETTKDSPQLRIKRDKILPQTPKDSKKIPTSLRTNNQPEPTTATTPPTTSNTPPTTSNTPPTTSNNLPQNQTIPNNQIKPDHIFKLTDSARLAIPLLPSASSNTYIPYFQATTPPTSDTLPPTQQPLEITPETEALVSPDSTPPTNPPGCVSTSQQTHTDQNPTEDKNFSITVIVMEPGKSNDSWHAKGAIDRTLDKLVTSLQQLVNRRKSARTTGSGGSVTEPINNDVSSRTIPGQSNQTISEEPFSVAMIVMDQSSSPKKNTADASVCTSSCLNQMNKEPDKEL